MNDNVPEARLAARREETRKSIEELRKRLLDLSNRNRLLNFSFPYRSRTHVRVIDELPDVLYGKLVDGKRLTFAALPEPQDEPQDEKSDEFLAAFQTACLSDEVYLSALKELGEEGDDASAVQRIERDLKDRVRTQLGLPPRPTRQSLTPVECARTKGLDPSYDLPRPQQNGQDKATYLDDVIQTLLFPEQMERKLAGIRDGARTALSEMGVNILYIAFGYLEWYENDASDRRFFAPLLLHPVEMGRALVRHTYRYFTTSTGDDSEINLTLKERLRADFSLVLPDFEEDDTPERYFAKVEDAIKDMKRWRVRRFVTIGLFAFGRLAMYHDLAPERWADNKALHLHPVLVELLGGSAIADVMNGKNLAIKGPPGTGKSQTITNILAAALAKGMNVLFVAEKMAALEVVKKRLDDAGLGEFCLELHSTKARKQDVLASLGIDKRLELRRLPEPPGLAETIEEHERLRKQLTWYVALINQPFGQAGKSLQQLFWSGMRSRMRAKELGLPVGLEDIILAGALDFTPIDLDRRRAALAAMEMRAAAFAQTYSATEKHPWAGIHRSPFTQQELLRALADWHTALLVLEQEAKRVESEFGISAPKTAEEASRLAKALALLPEDADEIATDILPKLKANGALAALEKFLVRVQSWNERIDSLSSQLEAPAKRLPRAETVWALDAARCELEVDGQVFAGQVGTLSELAKRYHGLARLAERPCTTAKRLFELAGVRAALTAPILSSLLTAVTLLRSTPREILLKRSPALLDETAHPVLERAAARAQAIVERHKDLTKGFSFSVSDSPPGYREHAAALRSVSFFGRFFSSEFRRSYAVWRGLRKSRVKAHPMEMAQEAEALAEHLKEIQKFHADDRLKAICGTEFEGITTDFNGLLAVNDFARRVEDCFPGTALGNCETRRLLLEADCTTLDAVLAKVDEHVVANLRAFLSTLEGTGAQLDAETELETTCRVYIKTAEQMETLYRACKAASLRDEVALGGLAALADVLAEEMDWLFAHNDHAEGYRKRWEGTLEPFFVKNLENVQGDERGVIFISTVYGPEQRGSRVAQRFGPINAATGHRRLNVLFTRAKEKVIIFSSMTSEDVVPHATSRLGVGILKHYLAYARDGRLDPGTPSGREPDSDFEVFVANRLRQHGFEVVPQVGVAGYFIDLAVRDPRHRDHYLLGIECDGATYHSAKSARDRDRLRQEILERMGWNLYRIWSTDWFSDPNREMGKLLRHIQGLTQSAPPVGRLPDAGSGASGSIL